MRVRREAGAWRQDARPLVAQSARDRPAIVRAGHARFEVLSPTLIRLGTSFRGRRMMAMARYDTMLRPGDPRWRELEHASGTVSPAEALRRGIALSRVAVRLKVAGRRALDERRA